MHPVHDNLNTTRDSANNSKNDSHTIHQLSVSKIKSRSFLKEMVTLQLCNHRVMHSVGRFDPEGGGGGTLGISGWGYAAGTLEPLTYTRASSAEFCYPILE